MQQIASDVNSKFRSCQWMPKSVTQHSGAYWKSLDTHEAGTVTDENLSSWASLLGSISSLSLKYAEAFLFLKQKTILLISSCRQTSLKKKSKHISLTTSSSSIYRIWLLLLLFHRNCTRWLPNVTTFSLVSVFVLLDHQLGFLQKVCLLEGVFFWISLALWVCVLAPSFLSNDFS